MKKRESCAVAHADYRDEDAFDPGEIELAVNPGWELLGDEGYVNDYGWTILDADVPIKRVEKLLAGHGIDYHRLDVLHEDDNYNQRGTSETSGWWCYYIFVPSPELERAQAAIRAAKGE